MSLPLMICSQKLFLCKQTSAGELGLDCLEKSEILLEGIWGVHLGMTSPEAIFPGSLRPTVYQGLVWSISVQVGGHLGAILLCCRSHKSCNLGSFSVSPTLTDESSFVYPLISEKNLTDWTL